MRFTWGKSATAGFVVGGVLAGVTVAAATGALVVKGQNNSGASLNCPGGVTSLEHIFDESNSMFPGDPETHISLAATVQNDGYQVEAVELGTHTGTHIDAPGHFIQGGRLLDDLRARELVMPVYVIDVRARIAQVLSTGGTPDFQLSVGDIKAVEKAQGRIPARALVVIQTGFDAYFGTPAYDDPAPGCSGDTVQWLVDNRNVSGLGSDTYGPDATSDGDFMATYTILLNDGIAVPGLDNVSQLNRTGDILILSPVRLRDGSGFQINPLACHGRR